MSDVLSQSQIDELLKNLNNADSQTLEDMSDSLSEKKVKSYDFKAPKKFTKEQLKSIGTIYESYARLFSSYLTSVTRFYCKVEVLQIEEQCFYEFNNALPDCTLMGNIDLSFNEGDDIMDTRCMIQFSNSVSFSLIDRLLGGYGRNMDLSRNFTDIEIRVMRNIFEKMGAFIKEVFLPYVDVTSSLSDIETNARVNQPIAADEVIVLATLQVEYNDVKNIITITIPAITMEAIISKAHIANTGRKLSDPEKEKEYRDGMIKRISRSEFKIEAVLAKTQVDLSEILALHPNDVLMLNVPIDHNISLIVNNEKLFDGKMGIVNHKKAIKICNVYDTRR
ncbi:flagellar motor switch protein FliM [Porcipelethomonas sp.]|uniref:flagellar motor switch protein FliM n=1 Tax=Porcipelethomonas sp. TaxID=2981675 RepID=UPI003EF4FD94